MTDLYTGLVARKVLRANTPGTLLGSTVARKVLRSGSMALTPSGIASGETVGSPLLIGPIVPTGIPSGEAMGSPIILTGAILTPTGIASGEVLGTPHLLLGGGARIFFHAFP